MYKAVIVMSMFVAACGAGQAGPKDPDGDLAAPGTEPTDIQFAQDDQTSTQGEFHLSVKRDFGDEIEAGLLQKAEALEPPRDNVLAAIGGASAQTALGIVAEEPLWWYAEFDGVRIPWAVTEGAITYYAKVVEAFRKGDFTVSDGVVMQKAALTYEAKVGRKDKIDIEGQVFQDVYVVEMTLGWSQYCGPECAMAFFKQRIVVFDGQGNPVAVFHDGKTQYVVS